MGYIIAIGFILWLIYSNSIQKQTIALLAKQCMGLEAKLQSMTKSHEEDHLKNHGCMPGEFIHPAHAKLKAEKERS